MRYLGGKSKIAPALGRAIARSVGSHCSVWEPFMGGAHMTEYFARTRRGIAGDAHPALMAMWRALRAGWDPPTRVTREEHASARELPDTDPRKAFIGFGCSFGGLYFSGYASDIDRVDTRWRAGARRSYTVVRRIWPEESRRAVKRISRRIRRFELECASFFDRAPGPDERFSFIYCDPPYAGTTGYDATAAFDHAEFWRRCREWSRLVPVLVSEYACPVPHRVLLETRHSRSVQVRTIAASHEAAPVERLFRVEPPFRVRTRSSSGSAASSALG